MAENLAQMFIAATTEDPTRPLITWYDDESGERTELSGVTLHNWAAKTANMLVDSAGLAPGDEVAVLLPPHWQTAAVLLGCAYAAAAVATEPPHPVPALFTAVDRLPEAAAWSAVDCYALSLAPMAAPLAEVPAGCVDFVVEVRAHGDHFTPYPGDRDAGMLDRAKRRAAQLGLTARDRLLVDVDRHSDPVDWLLAPLAAGASVVLCTQLRQDRLTDRVAAEKVTATLA